MLLGQRTKTNGRADYDKLKILRITLHKENELPG